MRRSVLFFILMGLFVSSTVAESVLVTSGAPAVVTGGVGARALGMGNNYTAVANDFSAVFWNPAGLAFMPVREVNVGLEGLNMSAKTELGTSSTDYKRNQLQLSNVGLVRAIPTTRGGFAFALGYSSPYNLSDLRKFSGIDIVNINALGINGVDTLHRGDTLHYNEAKSYSVGDLGMWSVSVGWQLAEGLGIGVTGSLINGSEKMHASILSHSHKVKRDVGEDSLFDNGEDYYTKISYTGYDFRAGVLYKINQYLSMGTMFDLPQTIRFKEQNSSGSISGELQSSLSGAVGLSGNLSFATISADAHFRAPNPDFDEGELSYWKGGAGLGVEVPVRPMNAMVRCGYSWQQFDLFPYAVYRGSTLLIDPAIVVSGKDNTMQMFTGGVTFVLSKKVTLDGAYALSRFTTISTDQTWKNTVVENYSNQRGTATISIRY